MRIESDILKTGLVIALLVGVYGGVVFWPGQRQNQALADDIQTKQAELNEMPRPDLQPLHEEIASMRAELRERSVVLPVGELDDRVLHHVSDTLIHHDVTRYETAYRQTKHYKRFAMTPIDVSFGTNFSNAFDIIRQVENAGPPVRIERLEITGKQDSTAGHVDVAIELSSFFTAGDEEGARDE